MIIVFFENESLPQEEKDKCEKITRERLKPVEEKFPEAVMTATWTKEGEIMLNSNHDQVVHYATAYLKH